MDVLPFVDDAGRSIARLKCAITGCGLSGRVHAWQQEVLLSTDDHRLSLRYLLACEGMKSTRADISFAFFERVFKDYGVLQAIRTRWHVLRLGKRPVCPLQALDLVAETRIKRSLWRFTT